MNDSGVEWIEFNLINVSSLGEIITFTLDSSGNFLGPIKIAKPLVSPFRPLIKKMYHISKFMLLESLVKIRFVQGFVGSCLIF